jgi:para-nitrobenzyl esterase
MMEERIAPEVTLPHGGRLRGVWLNGLRVFKGVRFAMSPFGALRFEAPVAEPPWSGVRDATRFAPVFPQWPRGGSDHSVAVGGEDALSVSVWAPEVMSDTKLPVLVWVHGGGFMRGGADHPLYDGATFARQGVVFVSIQYRLGVDGFAQLPDTIANRGLLDQLEALRWVHDSIAAWGGDPARVTVFGQSAGAGALTCLMAMPGSRGLFQQVVLQSPSVGCQTREEAEVALVAIAALAEVAPSRDALARAPLPRLLRAVHQLATDPALRRMHGMGSRHFFPLRPVIDGDVLPLEPLSALAQEWSVNGSPLRVLVGHNAQEMRFYYIPGGALEHVTEDDLTAFLCDAGMEAFTSEGSPGERLCAAQSRHYYAEPARRLAELASLHARSAHRYRFDWHSPQCEGMLGAAHGVELPFVFDNLDSPAAHEFTAANPPKDLARRMHDAWVRFACEGDPGWPRHAAPTSWTEIFNATTSHPQPIVDRSLTGDMP